LRGSLISLALGKVPCALGVATMPCSPRVVNEA
jgi:hypothetical protein